MMMMVDKGGFADSELSRRLDMDLESFLMEWNSRSSDYKMMCVELNSDSSSSSHDDLTLTPKIPKSFPCKTFPCTDLDSKNMMQDPPFPEWCAWCGGEEEETRNVRYAEAALKYYNKKNGTKYELVEALSSEMGLYGPIWVHCNFRAKKAVDGESKFFFAELEGHTFGLVPTACRILRGKTNGNCMVCTGGIIHPTGRFHMAQRPKYERKTLRPRSNSHIDSENKSLKNPPLPEWCAWSDGDEEEGYLPPSCMPGPEWDSEKESEKDAEEDPKTRNVRLAEAALKYYNNKNGTKYELVEALSSESGLYGSIWVHCNFRAKKAVDGESKLFFAELEGHGSGLVPTACRILRGKTNGNCMVCTGGIIHPTGGFHSAHQPNDEEKFP